MIESNDFLCPVCGKPLAKTGKSLLCEAGHCYDVAKAGYVNLLLVGKKNSVDPGDNKEMIRARSIVMAKGYYEPLARHIAGVLKKANCKKILDAGCGTGYICGRIKNLLTEPTVFGTDISKSAIEYAAKTYKDVNFAVASSIDTPFESGTFDAVLCAFAPAYEKEFARVGKENALFIRVTPAKEHLFGLKSYLYDEPRYNEKDETLFDGYDLVSDETVRGEFTGDGNEMTALIQMTPYYYHTSAEKLKRLEKIDTLTTNTAFDVRVFKKKG